MNNLKKQNCKIILKIQKIIVKSQHLIQTKILSKKRFPKPNKEHFRKS